jgi:hypothetical protein
LRISRPDERTEELIADVDAVADSIFRQAAAANGGAPVAKSGNPEPAEVLDAAVEVGAEVLDDAQEGAESFAKRAEAELDKRVDEGARALNGAQEDVEEFLDEAGKETEAQLDKAVEAGAEVLDDLEKNAQKAGKQVGPSLV